MPYTDKEKTKISSKKWYEANKDYYLNKSRQNKIRAREFVNNLKASTPCADCEQYFPAVAMDFDHVRGIKRKEISLMICNAWTLEPIKKEIKKCDIVCANCHRIRTYKRLHPL